MRLAAGETRHRWSLRGGVRTHVRRSCPRSARASRPGQGDPGAGHHSLEHHLLVGEGAAPTRSRRRARTRRPAGGPGRRSQAVASRRRRDRDCSSSVTNVRPRRRGADRAAPTDGEGTFRDCPVACDVRSGRRAAADRRRASAARRSRIRPRSTKAWMPVSVQVLTRELAEKLDAKAGRRLRVTRVLAALPNRA